jgi:hypothetical protein
MFDARPAWLPSLAAIGVIALTCMLGQ